MDTKENAAWNITGLVCTLLNVPVKFDNISLLKNDVGYIGSREALKERKELAILYDFYWKLYVKLSMHG